MFALTNVHEETLESVIRANGDVARQMDHIALAAKLAFGDLDRAEDDGLVAERRDEDVVIYEASGHDWHAVNMFRAADMKLLGQAAAFWSVIDIQHNRTELRNARWTDDTVVIEMIEILFAGLDGDEIYRLISNDMADVLRENNVTAHVRRLPRLDV